MLPPRLKLARDRVRFLAQFLSPSRDAQQRRLDAKPYTSGTHDLPHDVMVRELGAAGRSWFETLGGLGLSPISLGAAMDPEEQITPGGR